MSISKPRLLISPSVFAVRLIPEDYLNLLRDRFDVRTSFQPVKNKAEFLALCDGQDAILSLSSDSIDEEVVKATGFRLKVVSIASAGYDRLDTSAMKRHGVRVGTAGSAITNGTAELALTLLLCAARKLIPLSIQYKCDPTGCFRKENTPPDGLEDSTVGIIGAGRIGQSVARKVLPFEIKSLLYYSRVEKEEMKKLGGQLCSLEEIARKSDYIVVTLAYNAETDKIINEKFLNLMKPTAVIVNVGRGGLIDQDALVTALEEKRIGCAALDVTVPEPLPPGHPLLHLENALVSPHVGGITTNVIRKARDLAVANISAFFDNQPMPEELSL